MRTPWMSFCAGVALTTALTIVVIQTPAGAQERCSYIKTNHNCEVTLNRNSFVFPATLQLYPGAVVTVKIENGNDFELYTLDPAPGQATLLTDVTSTALTDLNTILAAAGSLTAATANAAPAAPAPASPPPSTTPNVAPYSALVTKTDPCKKDPNGSACRQERNAELANAVVQALAEQQKKDQADKDQKTEDAYNKYVATTPCDIGHVSQASPEGCMLHLLNVASHHILDVTYPTQAFYGELDTLLTPDSQPVYSPQPPGAPQPPDAIRPELDVSRPHLPFEHLLQELCGDPGYDQPCGLEHHHGLIHEEADASAFAAVLLARMTKPPTAVTVPPAHTPLPLSATVLNAMQLLTEEQGALDAIRKDLEGYASRLQDLAHHPMAVAGKVGYIQDPRDGRHVSRAVNYTLNRLNLVSNSQQAANDGSKKVPIVTIAVVYGEAHWDASTGVALAFRPIRTFTVAPQVSSGVQTGSYISENKASPEVAPFVAADYRFGHDFKLFGWRGAFYGTGGVGYNTSQESADLLVGPSISWRGLLLSGLCDFGHGTHLAQGLTVGESLGSTATPTTITTLPTTNYWVPAFTVGISVRIPGITGR